MKKEKLTLKKLQTQMETLIALGNTSQPSIKETISNQISNAAVSLKKLPFLGKFIKVFKLDKLTFWGVIIVVRKAFIYFNAMLGIYFVFKLAGVELTGINSFIAGLFGMGYSYLDLVKSFASKAIGSIFELFNYKVIPSNSGLSNPNVSVPLPSLGQVTELAQSTPKLPIGQGTNQGNIYDIIEEKIKETFRNKYMDPQVETTTPWYRDLTTWGYILGGVLATATVVGIGYIAYSYFITIYYPDVTPPGGDANTTPPSPTLSDRTINGQETPQPPVPPLPPQQPVPPVPHRRLPTIDTGVPPVPHIPTPMNPWKPGARLDIPLPSPTMGGVGLGKHGLTNPLSPDKVTDTNPQVLNNSLPPTPTEVKPSLPTIPESPFE